MKHHGRPSKQQLHLQMWATVSYDTLATVGRSPTVHTGCQAVVKERQIASNSTGTVPQWCIQYASINTVKAQVPTKQTSCSPNCMQDCGPQSPRRPPPLLPIPAAEAVECVAPLHSRLCTHEATRRGAHVPQGNDWLEFKELWRGLLLPTCKQALASGLATRPNFVAGIIHSKHLPIGSEQRQPHRAVDSVCVVHDLVNAGGRPSEEHEATWQQANIGAVACSHCVEQACCASCTPSGCASHLTPWLHSVSCYSPAIFDLPAEGLSCNSICYLAPTISAGCCKQYVVQNACHCCRAATLVVCAVIAWKACCYCCTYLPRLCVCLASKMTHWTAQQAVHNFSPGFT